MADSMLAAFVLLFTGFVAVTVRRRYLEVLDFARHLDRLKGTANLADAAMSKSDSTQSDEFYPADLQDLPVAIRRAIALDEFLTRVHEQGRRLLVEFDDGELAEVQYPSQGETPEGLGDQLTASQSMVDTLPKEIQVHRGDTTRSPTRLYVGNLPLSTTPEELEALFAEYGAVRSAQVIADRDSRRSPRRSRGFGFVEMEADESAERAIEALDGEDLEVHPVNVAEETGDER